ncbi:restriction endonuclease subunit S [Aliarcobacter butzleri]|uniref:restriction endonuclease subunit S n=1 Tax=Aliarcobacter butzleri TaxID=28197 RepID=UPI001EDC5D94|nr:restriction endonuclease subunit S [Aliarcobacter butzleri]MCG3709109.1 restriction endonuclease subunit S [Aliarcobacter butzleri]
MFDINNWEEFCLNDIFDIVPGKYRSKDEYEEGLTPYVSASANNNGIAQRINLQADFKGNAITTGKVGCIAFYQTEDFCASSDVNIFRAKKFVMNFKIGIFITSIINFSENYKWTYGRQCRVGDSKKIVIKLPILLDENQNPIIDKINKFNKKGYVPNFRFMEEVIDKIQKNETKDSIGNSLKTKNSNNKAVIRAQDWKEFFLHNLFNITMGNGIDANKTTDFEPKFNYVSRDSNGNGVVSIVDEIKGEKPFPAGAMSVALGGSFLGSCFIQKKPFYTAQNVAVLQEKELLSIHTKLFISALIRNECKIKYLAFGRELNSHIRKDFTIKLPILKNDNKVFFDSKKTYSENGFVPDWELMEEIIKTLPYGDRI